MGNRPLTIMNLISGNGRGGSDRLALDISTGLKHRGHRVIWGSPSYCELRDEASAAGLEIYEPYPSEENVLSGLPPLMTFCGDEKVDIVNSHQSKDRHLLLMARLRGLKSKIVFTRHCVLSGLPFVGAFYFNLIDMNIAVSSVVHRSLLRGGVFPKRAAAVYGGIVIDKFENPPAEKVQAARNRHYRSGALNIGVVARYTGGKVFRPDNPTMKGHETLFKALAAVPGDFNVLVLGVWGERDIGNLKAVAEYNGLSPLKLTFCDFQKEMAPFYKIMDLSVLPSRNEGLGLTLIEAMASGVPCIGADSGGIREIIDDGVTGFLFPPGDSNALSEKILTLREDAGTRDLFIRNGKEKVARLFDIKRTVNETEKIFYSLAGS
jgi:glycosyltransferase involved in cell wall biosynthesis